MNKINTLPSKYRQDIDKAITVLKSYGATEVYIFGSIANGSINDKSDIDIAVKGLKPDLFYKAASDLMFDLENEFDLIDLDDKENNFVKFIIRIGELVKVG